MLKPGSSDKRYQIISLVVLQLKAAVVQYHEEVEQQRAKAKIPKMVQEKESLKDHFVAMGMFRLDGQPLPLTNLFSNRLSTQNKVVHERYLNIEKHVESSVQKSSFAVVMHMKERDLGILATKVRRKFMWLIGEAPVRVRLDPSGVNPARVFKYNDALVLGSSTTSAATSLSVPERVCNTTRN